MKDDLISTLSEIRSQYNCFNESEEPYYRALSEAIKKLSEQADGDTISRQAALGIIQSLYPGMPRVPWLRKNWQKRYEPYINAEKAIRILPSAQVDIIYCKDCKFYSQMNRETKTGICNLTMHQNFGDNWFCAGAERRTDE